jgi:hypothetical protein
LFRAYGSRFGRLRVGNVAGQDKRPPALLFDLSAGVFEAIEPAANQADTCAAPRKLLSDGAPEPGTRAGNDHHFWSTRAVSAWHA